PVGLVPVRVDREGANVDESPEASVAQSGVEKIARREDRVHEGVGKRFLPGPRRQVIDHRHIFCRPDPIVARYEISPKQVNAGRMLSADRHVEGLEAIGPSSEAPNVAEAATQKIRDNASTDESRRSRDEDHVADADNLLDSLSRSVRA